MKKFGTNKRNPNPPWPNEQAVVMIPPGSNPSAVGMNGQRLYNMQNNTNTESQHPQNTVPENERTINNENYQIMGEMPPPTDKIALERIRNGLSPATNYINGMSNNTHMNPSAVDCGNAYITGYLCGQTGKYVRLEFLFGEQTHVEKTGVLREVGRNYIVMQEMGTNNMIVSPLDKIKFINIYNVNSPE